MRVIPIIKILNTRQSRDYFGYNKFLIMFNMSVSREAGTISDHHS